MKIFNSTTIKKYTHPQSVGILLVALLVGGLSLSMHFSKPAQAEMGSMDQMDKQVADATSQTAGGSDTNQMGFTDGWFQGRTVTFFYHNKNFFCKEPPKSGASSKCELGTAAQKMPTNPNNITPLYVMVPLGFKPAGLQCPDAGNCINHPHHIDLSAIFGKGTEDALLPAHSHIIDAADPGWWNVVVIGVKSEADWDKIAAGKDLATVRGLQQSDPTNVTADIPTNTFLFFDVLSHGHYQVDSSQLIKN